MRRILGWGALVALILGLSACASNVKYVAASTGGEGQIKFLYLDNSGEQGLIKCDRGDDGALTNCRKLEIVLEGE